MNPPSQDPVTPPQEPAAPPSAPETPTQPRPGQELAIDPFVARLARSMDITLKGAPDLPTTPVPDRGTPAPPAPPAPHAPPTPQAPAAPPSHSPTPVPAPTHDLHRAVDALATPVPAAPPSLTPTTTAQPAAPAPPIPEERLRGLTAEQLEEVELARFAETKGLTGQVEKVLGFFDQVTKFQADNPDATPDSEEFLTFVARNQPRYPNRRALERELTTVAASEAALRTIQPEVANLRKERAAAEIKPKIESAVQQAHQLITSEALMLPEGLPRLIPRDIYEVIERQGYEAAAKQYPVEAPLAVRASRLIRAHLEIVSGVRDLDPQIPEHRYLRDFVARQEQVAVGSKNAAGQTFLPQAEYVQACKDGKAKDHWTLRPSDIVDIIAAETHILANQHYRKLEEGGWKKVPKAQTPNGSPPTTQPPAHDDGDAPAASTSSAPPPGTGQGVVGPNAKFLERLVPGGSKVAI